MGRIGISSREGDCFYAVPFSKVEIYWLNISKGRIIAAMDRVEENVKLLISVREASKMLSISEKQMRNLSYELNLQVRIGRRVLIHRKKLEKWIDRQVS